MPTSDAPKNNCGARRWYWDMSFVLPTVPAPPTLSAHPEVSARSPSFMPSPLLIIMDKASQVLAREILA
jgi:hypothetical protein